MAKTDNIGDYLTDLANNFRLAMGSDAKINAQTMLTYPTQLANGYENYKTMISKNFQEVQDIYIPEGIEEIAEFAFSKTLNVDNNVINLNNIYIPEGVKVIQDYAFNQVTFNNLYLPKSITNINNKAFGGYKMTTLYPTYNLFYAGTLEDYCNISMSSDDSNPCYGKRGNFYINNELVREIVIPNTIKTLNKGLFSGFVFNKFSFQENSQVTELLTSSLPNYVDELYLPKSITKMKSSLQNISMKKFYYEGTLKDYFDIITEHSSSFFNNSANFEIYFNNEKLDLTKPLVIPDGVTTIYKYALRNWNRKVSTIIFPSTLTLIQDYGATSSVKNGIIIFKSNVPPTVQSYSLPNKINVAKVIVPKGRLEVYKSATNLSTYADIMVQSTTNVVNIDSSLMNNANILYSVDGGEKQQFTSPSFTLENIGALTIHNNSTDTINLGTTSGGSDIGASGSNTAITYTFTNDTTIYITKA